MPESQSDETELPAETHHTTSSQSNEIHSGVGVLDKTVKILDALESGPATLGQLVPRRAWPDRPRIDWRLRWSVTVLCCVISMVVSCLARVCGIGRCCRRGSFADRSRADFCRRCWIALANPRRFTAVKAICACASPPWSALPVCVIPFRLVRCCRWRPVPRPRFCWLGRIPNACIRGCVTPSSPRPSLPPCASAVGPSRSTSAMKAYARFPRRFAMLPVR